MEPTPIAITVALLLPLNFDFKLYIILTLSSPQLIKGPNYEKDGNVFERVFKEYKSYINNPFKKILHFKF